MKAKSKIAVLATAFIGLGLMSGCSNAEAEVDPNSIVTEVPAEDDGFDDDQNIFGQDDEPTPIPVPTETSDPEDETSAEDGSDAETAESTPDTLVLGDEVLLTNYTSTVRNSSSMSDHFVKCDEGQYVYSIEVEASVWGGEIFGDSDAMSWVKVHCRSLDGTETMTDKSGVNTSGSNEMSSACEDANEAVGFAITGLKVVYDEYIKNFYIQCGNVEVDTTEGSISIEDEDFYNGAILTDAKYHDGNDRTETLQCGNNQILTGLKIHYKDDGQKDERHEGAITYVQPYCTTLTLE